MNYKFWGYQNANNIHVMNSDFPGINTPLDLYDALTHIWCKKTCAPRLQNEWTTNNITLGQCSITAFLAQDIFGGKVYGILLPNGNYHCFNVIDNIKFDLTSEQFGAVILNYEKSEEQFKNVHFAKKEKYLRYLHLKNQLKAYLEAKH